MQRRYVWATAAMMALSAGAQGALAQESVSQAGMVRVDLSGFTEEVNNAVGKGVQLDLTSVLVPPELAAEVCNTDAASIAAGATECTATAMPASLVDYLRTSANDGTLTSGDTSAGQVDDDNSGSTDTGSETDGSGEGGGSDDTSGGENEQSGGDGTVNEEKGDGAGSDGSSESGN